MAEKDIWCPLSLSNPTGQIAPCMGDDCGWWVPAGFETPGGCAMALLGRQARDHFEQVAREEWKEENLAKCGFYVNPEATCNEFEDGRI